MELNEFPKPTFKSPPVIETVLAIQFKKIDKFRIPHLGLIFDRFRKRGFCKFEEYEPIEPVKEVFEIPDTAYFNIGLTQKLPVPRCWFINTNKDKMVQIQQDRFIFNWRRKDDPYPSYEEIRKIFSQEYSEFTDFIKDESLGNLVVDQCEIQYVNHIESGEVWKDFSEITKIFEFYKTPDKKEFLTHLKQPEKLHSHLTYIIENEKSKLKARLHIIIEPRTKNKKPIYTLNILVRGMPKGNDKDNIIEFFDFGREWIVKTFESITTSEMHKIWGKNNEE